MVLVLSNTEDAGMAEMAVGSISHSSKSDNQKKYHVIGRIPIGTTKCKEKEKNKFMNVLGLFR